MPAVLRRLAAAWLALSLLLGQAGCSLWSPPMSRGLLGGTPPDLPRQAQVDGVPFFAQHDTLCGPAVLASLLAQAGRPRTLQTLTEAVYLPGRQGSLQAEMLAGARRQGAAAVELPPDLSAVLGEVASGTPVGALLNLGLPWWPRWHYVVLLGYDLDRATVQVHSGGDANAHWSLRSFEHMWARSGHWAMAVRPPGQWPRSVTEAAALRALIGLDRAAPDPEDRRQAWASALVRWPQRASVAIGLAGALGDADRWQDAADTLQAASQRLESAAVWNNLARAQARLGDAATARQSALRAVARARSHEPPWLSLAEQTLAELPPP